MKLTELIKDAQDVLAEHGDVEVVLSKDGEGNTFSPLAAYGVGKYEAETTWHGEFFSLADSEEDEEDDWGPSSDAVLAMVLWPTN